MLESIIIALVLTSGAFLGYITGYSEGQKSIHSGKAECVTLPDKQIYCYTKKEEKQ